MSRSTATSRSSPATRCWSSTRRDRPPYGDQIVVRRKAVVTRAGALERMWTRLVGNLELTELYDVSFTERRFL